MEKALNKKKVEPFLTPPSTSSKTALCSVLTTGSRIREKI
jgi:hypothetical protein